jgi:hypothetical protein
VLILATIDLPWTPLRLGDNYLRGLLINCSGVETINIYTSTTFDGATGTPAQTLTYSSSTLSGARYLNLDILGPCVKVRATISGTSAKVFSFEYNYYETRIQ